VAGTSHVFSEIYLHVTWHCLENRALLTPEMERFLLAGAGIAPRCLLLLGVVPLLSKTNLSLLEIMIDFQNNLPFGVLKIISCAGKQPVCCLLNQAFSDRILMNIFDLLP